MKPSRRVLAAVLVIALASCGGSSTVDSSTIAREASAPAASTEAPTSTSPVSSTSFAGGSSTTSSPAATTVATVARTVTTVPPPNLEGAPGDVVVIDHILVDPANMATIPREPVQLEVWLVQRGFDDGLRQRSVHLGTASLGLDGRVQLRAVIPSVIATRDTKFGLAVPSPLAAGDYVIRGIANLAIPVRVTTSATERAVPSTRPGPMDAAHRILGEHDVAGVAFGTRDDDAEAALVARLGAPSERNDWQSACIGEARRVSWGALTVTFRRDGPSADGALASYAYGSIVPGHAEGSAGFATARDIRIGTTIEELRAVDDAAEVHTGYDGFVAANWTVRGSEIVATLDRDFLDAGAQVVRVASPRTATLQVC